MISKLEVIKVGDYYLNYTTKSTTLGVGNVALYLSPQMATVMTSSDISRISTFMLNKYKWLSLSDYNLMKTRAIQFIDTRDLSNNVRLYYKDYNITI